MLNYIKQPYFQGDDIPETKKGAVILVYYPWNTVVYGDENRDIEDIDWSEVIAYIEV